MQPVYVAADNITSPLGATTAQNYAAVSQGRSGLQPLQLPCMETELPAGIILPEQLAAYTAGLTVQGLTKFEQLVIASINEALGQTSIRLSQPRTLLLLSTTKGNIDWLEQHAGQVPDAAALRGMQLYDTAATIGAYFQASSPPLVVSNACISGLLAILTAKRLMASGQYDQVVIAGADILTQFVVSGFSSFHALSSQVCRPFDVARNGLNLGEAAATLVLTNNPALQSPVSNIRIGGGGVSNDANHISGPSRTGAELALALQKAIDNTELSPKEIAFISAHGTATPYNDEMEAKAFGLAGIAHAPVFSLKGYYGHTLGAAGLLESIVSMHALLHNCLLATPGFETLGVSQPLDISNQSRYQPGMQHFIKTTSGFGGCNAAMVFSKF
ncbi:3-oxoacyl-[acyl-carrier-protein] synthase-1 [Chitinophaga costaii]|uniref:3-oxoacyl-[acyl-carrier-protein] synthase-1 n=1 Tax=Chitinophaga costaii TaxID=1335309 RepID=A0A1C3ZHE5_9BACT|nr:beta-ketoacyl synthase N-terminal-like domain-containing protein [Chitinophaga costaii]PUZ30375.1 beta-ketoacyl synthase [Chitinophaga costaii]SCB81839.1 3-oxoacyl-[acyl-carrier-protein] synthase-1 [Chitinophaga costaii]